MTKLVEVKVLLYKATASTATLSDKVIAWWTNSKYSHCEIVVDGTNIAVHPDSIEATEYVSGMDYEFDAVDLQLQVTEEQYDNFWEYVSTNILGKKYDWLGIGVSQVVKVGVQDDSKWTCSEATSKMLQVLGDSRFWSIHPGDMSPGDIAEILLGKDRR